MVCRTAISKKRLFIIYTSSLEHFMALLVALSLRSRAAIPFAALEKIQLKSEYVVIIHLSGWGDKDSSPTCRLWRTDRLSIR